jgi:prepilin-type N-terminal cleavage/methylation domain-containing protein
MGRQSRKAFTLIEMLVVISILTLLIGILAPSLKKAREQSKDTLCRSNLHAVYLATLTYLHDWKTFPELNNLPDDGTWQYNYLIYDGRDFDENFGPLVNEGRNLDTVELLYCPRQTDPFHSFATAENPWPVVPLLDTRSSYGRKNHLTGRSVDQLRGNPAIMADVFHLPKVVRSAHKTGINAVNLGGDVHWVPDTGFLTDNELTHPFQPEDNDLMENMWDKINRGEQ